MNSINHNNEVQALRELNLDEIGEVSGGVKWSCTGKVSSNGGSEISCTVSSD